MNKVFLIGAGPGACDLLTVRAARILGQEAEVVLADALVSDDVLALVHPAARVLRVGKRGWRPSTSQDFIHRLMVRYARRGKVVVRLKGGDPFVFGRGGEEIQALAAAGVEAEVVPGITSGIAAPSAAGIPVTHRAHTHGVTFVTGTCGDGSGPDWGALAKTGTTLVIYMGLSRVQAIVEGLVAAGMSPHMPTAAITAGTTQEQRHLVCPLAELSSCIDAEKFSSPTILVVGEVAALGHEATGALAVRAVA